MRVVPWRVKSFVSTHFPLLYHVLANLGTRGNSVEHWDARLASTWDSPKRAWPAKSALLGSLIGQGAVVLDVGCGDGSILRDLQRQGFRNLHGLEISRYAIERLESCGITMHYGILPRIPLDNGVFDAVIASQVLEHIIRRTAFVREIRRILKPRGEAFFFVPDNCLPPIDEKEHVICYNAESLRKFLGKYFGIMSIQSMRDPNHDMRILFAHVRREAGS